MSIVINIREPMVAMVAAAMMAAAMAAAAMAAAAMVVMATVVMVVAAMAAMVVAEMVVAGEGIEPPSRDPNVSRLYHLPFPSRKGCCKQL